ncbi:hypothetical protein SDRG_12424 [Saprolegnia diclina VS20]|uniref:Dynein heavy chain tail domain-containing protein n=1 Tax=Saprolegnia diclina (strain VS20) TaxID=1156394 RepID=T0Q8T4_SAPDV|nr:hypothetical protein SDRG_12424 [Saprolegnia diclina VS20]EQC29880.1 hypothetical protein SDRG_12424 [Saprolegnia diclina VS20]|eukprot:XP_008616719.1 hypothetical protein SDRG_12424 [Saprolegnia diclina VS20]
MRLLIQARRTYNDAVRSVLELCSRLVPLLEPNLTTVATKDHDQVLAELLIKGKSLLPEEIEAIRNTKNALTTATGLLPELKLALANLGRPVHATSKSSNWVALVFENMTNNLEADTAVWEATTLCCAGAADSIKSATAAVTDEMSVLCTLAEAFKTAHFRSAWHRNVGSETDYASWMDDAVEKLHAHCKAYLSRHNAH